MGTRNLTCVYVNNDLKIAQYGQWDGYPSGVGQTILQFLRDEMEDGFEDLVAECEWVEKEKVEDWYVECGAKRGAKRISMDISECMKNQHPEIHRDTSGGKLLRLIQERNEPLELQNDIEFAKDSLFCEWCYVVDFDKGTFEVYRGFNQSPLAENERFHDNGRLAKQEHRDEDCKYHPVSLLTSFRLDDLPSDDEFVETCENLNPEEDE